MVRYIRSLNKLLSIVILIMIGLFMLYPLPVEGNVAVRAKHWLERNIDSMNDHRVYIESIGVDMKIVEGDDETALLRGAWREPTSGSPEGEKGMILSGHRYMYTSGPNTFFHLERVAHGDMIKIRWDGEDYLYKVYANSIISSDAIEIKVAQKDELVLITCYPLWSSEQRLAIKARRVV